MLFSSSSPETAKTTMTCARRLSLVVITLLVSSAPMLPARGCSVLMNGIGTVNPQGQVREPVGATLRLECVLNKNVEHGSAENLSWKKNGVTLPRDRINIIDNYTAELLVPNVTIADSGTYMCNLNTPKNTTMFVCHNNVEIGYPPLNVTDFSCQSPNFEYLLCTFTDPPNPIATKYSLSLLWSASLVTSVNVSRSRPQMRTYKTNITSHSRPVYRPAQQEYHFRLEAKNALGFSVMDFVVDQYTRILPNKPADLAASVNGSTRLRLTWVKPFSTVFAVPLDYRLYYRSQWDPTDEWRTLLLKEPNYTLADLQPFTAYEVKIQTRPSAATDEALWSHNATVTAKTLPAVPGLPPNLTLSSFQQIGFIDHRAIRVYWQMIPDYQRNGANFTYKVTASPVAASAARRRRSAPEMLLQPANVTENFAEFSRLELDTAYMFTVHSQNAEGLSERASHLRVDRRNAMAESPDSFTVIYFDHGVYELSWVPPKRNQFSGYTLFWCNDIMPHPFTCRGNLSWVDVDKSVTAYNVTLPTQKFNFQFAMATNTATSTSGMVWATCIVPYNGTLSKMKKVGINSCDETSFKVTWKLDCSERIGIVKEFKIYYCEIGGNPNVTHDARCLGGERNVTAAGSHTEESVISGLRPYTWYKVTVSAVTRAGEGEQSVAIYKATTESKPYSAAERIETGDVTNGSIALSWDAPTVPNGVITRYRVLYNRDVAEVEVRDARQHTTHHRLTGLRPYTNYSIRLEACTRRGCSPESKPARVVRTLVGVPGRMSKPSVNNANNASSILVTFEAPADTNGRVDYYNLFKVRQLSDGTNTTTEHRQLTELSLPLTIQCEDSEQAEATFLFAVQAVNVAGNETLEGPLSDYDEYRCNGFSEILGTGAIFAVVGGAVGATLLLMLIAYAYLRFRRHVQNIKNIKIFLPRGLEPDNPKLPSEFNNYITAPPQNGGKVFHPKQNGSPRSRNTSGDTRVSSSSMDELLQHNNPENRTECSGDSGSALGSVSSAQTTRSNLSSDSGHDIDSLAPTTPDMVFSDNPMAPLTGGHTNIPPTILEKTPESSTPPSYSRFAQYLASDESRTGSDGYLPTVGSTSALQDAGYVLPSVAVPPPALPYSQVGVAAGSAPYVNVPHDDDDDDVGVESNGPLSYSRVGVADREPAAFRRGSQPAMGYSAVALADMPRQNPASNGYVMAGDPRFLSAAPAATTSVPLSNAPPPPTTTKSSPSEKQPVAKQQPSPARSASPLPESYSRLSLHDPSLVPSPGYVALPASAPVDKITPVGSPKPTTSGLLTDVANNSGGSKPPVAGGKNGYVSLNAAADLSNPSSPLWPDSHRDGIMKTSATSDEYSDSPGPYSRVVSMSFDEQNDNLPSPKDT